MSLSSLKAYNTSLVPVPRWLASQEVVIERFWLACLVLFVAFDMMGHLPSVWRLGERFSGVKRQEVIHQSVVVGFFFLWAFLALSRWVFAELGVQLADLLIGGGLIVVVLAIRRLVHPGEMLGESAEPAGWLPLGVPLLTGPTVLVTVVLAREHFGGWATMGGLCFNMLLAWLVLLNADRFMGWLGHAGARMLSQVVSLVLAVFGVAAVRLGVLALIPTP